VRLVQRVEFALFCMDDGKPKEDDAEEETVDGTEEVDVLVGCNKSMGPVRARGEETKLDLDARRGFAIMILGGERLEVPGRRALRGRTTCHVERTRTATGMCETSGEGERVSGGAKRSCPAAVWCC